MKSAKNSLYDDLKRQILTVELEPDEDLDEVILSERYGLSRTPVREIFRRLAGEGYVDIRENRGTRVVPMNHSTWRNRSGAAGAANALSPRKGSGFEGGGSPRCHSLVRPGAGTATAFEENRHGPVCRIGRFAGRDDGACPG